MALRFLPGLFGLLQVIMQLPLAIAIEFQGLFNAADVGANAVIPRLHLVEAVIQLGVLVALFFYFTIGVALLGDDCLQRDFLTLYLLFALFGECIQPLPAQGLQLGLELSLFGFPALVFLC